MTSNPDAAALRGVSLRVTAPRVAVLAELRCRPHADVDTLAGAVRRRLGSVSTQAVYDVLRALNDAGLVRRIEPAGSPARFELRVGDNHHHLVCRLCGTVADVDCAVGAAPCLEPSDLNGFAIDEAEVIYWGLCPDCRTVPGSAALTGTPAPTSTSAPISTSAPTRTSAPNLNHNGGTTP